MTWSVAIFAKRVKESRFCLYQAIWEKIREKKSLMAKDLRITNITDMRNSQE